MPSPQQPQVIANERPGDVPDVAGEIEKDRDQRAELNHRDRGSQLLGREAKIHGATRQNQMRRRAYRDEFS